jgi:hypothetical protein
MTDQHLQFQNMKLSALPSLLPMRSRTLVCNHSREKKRRLKCVKTDTVPWDVDRYADMVKCSPVQTKGSEQHAKLQKYFGRTKIGKIGEPATIVDCHGKILVWFLPDILSLCRIVRF